MTTSTNHVTISTPRVHTMQITVSALRIGTKQVTQSVFRQLPRRPVWHPETGHLQGTPWGLVNYFWNDCGPTWPERPHLHVVWQGGERLFRDCLFDPANWIPSGVEAAVQRTRAQEKQVLFAAHYVSAVARYHLGCELTPYAPSQKVSVSWPCGLTTSFRYSSHGNGDDEVTSPWRDHLCAIVALLTPEALSYNHSQRETCTQRDQPEGLDWKMDNTYSPPRWWRYYTETDEERDARIRTKLAEAFARLAEALRVGTETWELTQIPRSGNDAKEQLNHVAQALLTARAQEKQLREQFEQTFLHCVELDQLFIAV